MEHFPTIQDIIRTGLSGDIKALEKQAMRFQKQLRTAGLNKEAATVGRFLKSVPKIKNMEPTRLEVSRGHISGEVLTSNTKAPIDRETGAALCDIFFPPGERIVPVYDHRVYGIISGLLDEWSNMDALRKLDVEPTRSLLIFGPPGSGKTLTAHYIAEQLDLPLVTARIDGLISSFLGTTARNIANLFSFANRYSCLLFLDEFDALAKVRDDSQEIGEIKRVVNSLLQNLDQRSDFGITIAATNHERLLDTAVWRRFETHVHIGEPCTQARIKMIRRFLAPLEPDLSIFDVIAYCLEGYSGADLKRICVSLKRSLALSDVNHDAPGIFYMLHVVLGRLPIQDHEPVRILATNPDAFISLIANDPDFPLKQAEIGRATGYSQSRISDIKKAKRHYD